MNGVLALLFEQEMVTWQYELIFVFRMMLAIILGAIVGVEREHRNRAAGFRTHILVSLGACVFMLVSISMPMLIGSMSPGIVNNADPGRIAAQVVSGIGFLGAGTIMQAKGKVHGLTTAASLWMVAAVGMAAGAGLYVTAIFSTIAIMVVLTWFTELEVHADRVMTRMDHEREKRKNQCVQLCMEEDEIHDAMKQGYTIKELDDDDREGIFSEYDEIVYDENEMH